MGGVNNQTRRINYPLPKIEDILIKQGSKQIFSIIDLKQAFHQQPLQPREQTLHVHIYARRHLPMASERNGSHKRLATIPTNDGR